MTKAAQLKKPVIFLDFDNTITMFDVLDDMLTRFSRNDNWLKLEEKWKNGEIGSRECLQGQVEGMAITKKALDGYLAGIKIDPSFKKLMALLKSKKIAAFILSDNFEYILKRILKNHGIGDLSIYANKLNISGERLRPSFPLTNESCGALRLRSGRRPELLSKDGDCAHCKRTSLLKNVDGGSTSIYVGDGKSDVCASQSADIVFAKGYLRDYCKTRRLSHIPFKDLKDVYEYFKRSAQ